ncbi:hypothetical protein BN1318_1370008 [Staphylococcus capitis]|nr:hypothetical protein BN1318_1370008 [Staphylococcus capitis]
MATKYIIINIVAIRLRPKTSEIGPNKNCPSASPIIAKDSVNWISEVVVPKSCCTLGKEGVYVSIVSGPNAVMTPKIMINIIEKCLALE